jgi:hypothetical protein
VAGAANPIDDAGFFVRQHYLDFLGREADAAGLAFWTNNITSCGANVACIEAKRVETSASFFLSIEFQETGGYAQRIQRTAFWAAFKRSVHALSVSTVYARQPDDRAGRGNRRARSQRFA